MEQSNSTISFKAGYVALLGQPNVGKSTLLNALMAQKIAAVSPRPQTTRKLQLGILTLENAQIVFIDTPGVHKPLHKLGEYMNAEARTALEDADILLFMVDALQPPKDEDRLLANMITSLKKPKTLILTLNKVDMISTVEANIRQAEFLELVPGAITVQISALQAQGTAELLDLLVDQLPEGVPFYDPDQVTDLYERDIAADLIREAALLQLRDEVPHCITIRIDEFRERNENGAYIAATLFVERESQKGIVIGQGGSMLKKIGSLARQEIEQATGRKVYLDLRVKVFKNWRNNADALRLLGFVQRK